MPKVQTASKKVKIEPLNKRKGGSYVKDPKTGERTLIQETKREPLQPEKVEK